MNIFLEEQADLFISWLDPEIRFWNSRYSNNAIPESMRDKYALNFRKDLDSLYDKFQLAKILKNMNLRTPCTQLLSQIGNCRSWNYPVVIKPRIGFGSRETHILFSSHDVENLMSTFRRRSLPLEDFIIQEFIEGTEYTIDFYADQGAIVNSVIRSRLEHRGISLRGEIVDDESINATILIVCKVLLLNSLNNIQIIKRDNCCYITDINLRPSGTIMFSIKAGVDLIENVIERAEKRPLTRFGKPRPLRMVRYLKEFYYE